MNPKDNNGHIIITDHRIKQTLKNLIKDDFLQKYHTHPAERQKATKIAQKHLTDYCRTILSNKKFFSVLCHKILLDTYYVSPELQEKYSESSFKEILEQRITILWPQLEQLSLKDWEEYNSDQIENTPNPSLKKDMIHYYSYIEIIHLWLTELLSYLS